MKKFLKVITVIISLVLAFSLTACTKEEKTDEKKTSQTQVDKKRDGGGESGGKEVVKKSKASLTKDNRETKKKETEKAQKNSGQADKSDSRVIVMATNAEFPPFEYIENGEMVGAEIDMAYAIAEKLGMKLQIINMDFDAVVTGAALGKCDMAISGISVTDERRESMNFSDPYYVASQAIIVMEDSHIRTSADLYGKIIACQEGTVGEQYTLDNNYDVQSYKTGADAIAALTAGKVDAVVIDDAVARALSKANKSTKVLDEALAKEEYAVALKLGNDELTERINKAIYELKKEGRLKEIFERYDLAYGNV